jgi:ABC-type antimicrobial peptide transport system permease subunit
MFGVFGVLALVVAAVGLFSVVSYLVAQRTHEFGVRIALGAGSRRITQLVLGGAFRAAATGIGLGIVGALAIGPAVQSLLFDTSPRDPAVLAVVAVTMLLTALVAGVLPSLRACRVDPVVALRSD